MHYTKRIIEEEMAENLRATGALLVRGPKACGKTMTAGRIAGSVLHVDTDPSVAAFMDFQPEALLEGATPRLLDEWQEQPKLWNLVRRAVDRRQKPGQFILTGSATPDDSIKTHSGAGRFAVSAMRTLSWFELGHSSGKTSLAALLSGKPPPAASTKVTLHDIASRLIIGGWPGNLGKSLAAAARANAGYLDLAANADVSRVSGVSRNPDRVMALFKSIARNIATAADTQTLARDAAQDTASFSRDTAADYLGVFNRLMLVEDQPAFNTHVRSAAALRKTPKRHFADPSLAVAALGLDAAALVNNPKYLGFLFESQVVHDLRVYAQANDATVSYYRDSYDNEVDAIVQKRSGEWAAFEVKLGASAVDEAAGNLLKLAGDFSSPPASLTIITGTGLTYRRPDGVNVVSLSSLGV